MGFLNGLLGDMMRESTGYDLRKMRKLGKMVGKKNLLLLGAGAAVAGGVAASSAGQQQFGTAPGTGPSSWAAPTGPPAPNAPPQHPPASAPPTGALPPIPGASPPAAAPPPLPPVPGSAPAATPVAPPAGAEPLPAPRPAGPPPGSSPGSLPAESNPVAAPAGNDSDEIEISPDLTYAIVRTMVAAALADGHLSEEEKGAIHGRLGSSGLASDRIQQVHRDLVIPPSPAELAGMTAEASELEAMYRFAGLLILADGQVSELERSWLDRLAVAFGFDGAKKAGLEAEIFA